jgi:hypothetical protein
LVTVTEKRTCFPRSGFPKGPEILTLRGFSLTGLSSLASGASLRLQPGESASIVQTAVEIRRFDLFKIASLV